MPAVVIQAPRALRGNGGSLHVDVDAGPEAIGLVCHTFHGKIRRTHAKRLSGSPDSVWRESRAIREALSYIRGGHWSVATIWTDCLGAIESRRKERRRPKRPKTGALIVLRWMPREWNIEADYMASRRPGWVIGERMKFPACDRRPDEWRAARMLATAQRPEFRWPGPCP